MKGLVSMLELIWTAVFELAVSHWQLALNEAS